LRTKRAMRMTTWHLRCPLPRRRQKNKLVELKRTLENLKEQVLSEAGAK